MNVTYGTPAVVQLSMVAVETDIRHNTNWRYKQLNVVHQLPFINYYSLEVFIEFPYKIKYRFEDKYASRRPENGVWQNSNDGKLFRRFVLRTVEFYKEKSKVCTYNNA